MAADAVVVDATVAVKWLIPEDDSHLAAALRTRAMSAPDLIAAEVANVLWKHVARGDLGAGDAGRAIAVFAEADLALFPAMPLMERALAIAIDLGHPAYDCFYLALADQLGVPLVTSDSRLIRAAHGKGFAKVVALASLAS